MKDSFLNLPKARKHRRLARGENYEFQLEEGGWIREKNSDARFRLANRRIFVAKDPSRVDEFTPYPINDDWLSRIPRFLPFSKIPHTVDYFFSNNFKPTSNTEFQLRREFSDIKTIRLGRLFPEPEKISSDLKINTENAERILSSFGLGELPEKRKFLGGKEQAIIYQENYRLCRLDQQDFDKLTRDRLPGSPKITQIGMKGASFYIPSTPFKISRGRYRFYALPPSKWKGTVRRRLALIFDLPGNDSQLDILAGLFSQPEYTLESFSKPLQFPRGLWIWVPRVNWKIFSNERDFLEKKIQANPRIGRLLWIIHGINCNRELRRYLREDVSKPIRREFEFSNTEFVFEFPRNPRVGEEEIFIRSHLRLHAMTLRTNWIPSWKRYKNRGSNAGRCGIDSSSGYSVFTA